MLEPLILTSSLVLAPAAPAPADLGVAPAVSLAVAVDRNTAPDEMRSRRSPFSPPVRSPYSPPPRS